MRDEFICTGPAKKKHAANCTVEVLLTQKKDRSATSNIKARIQQESPMWRDRGSWVMVQVELDMEGRTSHVDEDLALWILPCTPREDEQLERPAAAPGVEEVAMGCIVAANGDGARVRVQLGASPRRDSRDGQVAVTPATAKRNYTAGPHPRG